MMVGIVLQKMYCLYLAAGDAHEQRIAVLDHVVIGDGFANIAFQALFQALKIL